MANNSRLKFGKVNSSTVYRGGEDDNSFIRVTVGTIESANSTLSGITDFGSGYKGLEYALPGNSIYILTGTTPTTFTTTITSIDYDNNTVEVDPAPNFNNTNRLSFIRLQKGLNFVESGSLTVPNNAAWNYNDVTGSLDDEFTTGDTKYGFLGQLAFTSSVSSLIGGYFGQYEIIKTFSDRTTTNLSFFITSSTGTLSEDEDKSIGSGQSNFGIVELSLEKNLATIFDGGDIGSDSLDSLGLSTYAAAVNTVIDSNLGGGGFPYTGSALITGSLGVTGSANFLKGEGETDFFLIRSSSFTSLKMNSDGVAVFGDFNSLPTAIAGGFAYSASNFYAGIE